MFNPGNYFFPGYGIPYGYMGPRGLGLFRNMGRGMGFFKNINWGNLFNNTSKALGVVNKAIPIIKQAGPMFNNMRSMLRVASAFKDVTDPDIKKTTSNKTSNSNNYHNNYDINSNVYRYNNSPNFFI